MKKFCISISCNWFWKEGNVALNKKRVQKSHQNSVGCYICRKEFTQKLAEDKTHWKIIILLLNAEMQHIVYVA